MPDPSYIAQLGMQTAGNVVGAGMGLLLGGVERRRQMEQQRQLQEMQIQGQKQMTDYQMKQQLAMWKATGPMGQMEQLKLAGLNPGLIYGMGGAGGQTAQVAQGNVSQGQVHKGGEAAAMGIQMGQAAMQAAQIENLKANTAKTLEEAKNVPKAGTKLDVETASLTQGIENQKSQKALTDVQTAIASIDEHIKGMGQNAAVATIMKNLEILNNDAQISEATKLNKIKLIAAELSNKIADTLNKQKQTAKSQKEMDEIDAKIKLHQQQWDINSIDQEMAKDGMNPKAGNLLKLLHNMLRGIAGTLGL